MSRNIINRDATILKPHMPLSLCQGHAADHQGAVVHLVSPAAVDLDATVHEFEGSRADLGQQGLSAQHEEKEIAEDLHVFANAAPASVGWATSTTASIKCKGTARSQVMYQ